ncbi:squalene synthase HpnC [Bacteroidota bacterium]
MKLAYKEAEIFAKSHYENFPVISRFLPKELGKHVAVVYQFARQADDIADEGDISRDLRKKKLQEYENQLIKCKAGECENIFWNALRETITNYNLSYKHFHNLLVAFNMDIEKRRFINFDEILGYCFYSANPVGRIILEFFDIRDPESIEYSDAVCTALQLTNFYQDIGVDFQKDRIYIPQNEMLQFGVDEKNFENKKNNDNFRKLLEYQVERVKELFIKGRKLLDRLPNKLKYQIAWTILGGEEILNKIEKINYNVLNKRPVLTKIDYFQLMLKSFFI